MLDPGPSGARPVLWTAEDPLPGTFMVATRPRALAAGMKGGRREPRSWMWLLF